MIRGQLEVCGTISEPATLHPDKQGIMYIHFAIQVNVPTHDNSYKKCRIAVRKKHSTSSQLSRYRKGKCVYACGMLNIYKGKDNLYLNLTAEKTALQPKGSADQIAGELEFYGTVGKEPDIRDAKNGKKFFLFPGFSSEQRKEERMFTWVHFLYFSDKEEKFLHKGNGIHAKGKLEITYYKDRINLGCRVREITPWGKKLQKDTYSEKNDSIAETSHPNYPEKA